MNIQIRNLHKTFSTPGGAFDVLDNINLKVNRGEFITIFGPNGCGKTTLLLILAGILDPTSGEIKIGGMPPEQAKIGFVFQDYHDSMFPWRDVLGNVELGLEAQKMDKNERKAIAEWYLGKVGMLEHKRKYPYHLSGGMKQLVAIARALASKPHVLLLDEPFSSLDYYTRLSMEEKMQGLWGTIKNTTIFVSHDIDEAITLADKVVVLTKRPATVKEVVRVGIPRPRTIKTRSSEEFFKLRSRILSTFSS